MASETVTEPGRPRVAALSRSGDKEYPMFDVAELRSDRIELEGPLLLEVGEPLTLTLSLDDATLRLDARVEAVDAERSRMTLRFVATGVAEQQLLAEAAGSW